MKKLSVLLFILILCLYASFSPAETEGEFTYFIHDRKATITAYTGHAVRLTVPDILGGYPVTAINYCAFRDCTSLAQVTLPDGLLTIGSNAFQGCTSLVQVDLPDTLAFIGTHAFYQCAKLSQIMLPESIERLHPYAFYGCSAARICSLFGHAALVLTNFGYAFTPPDYPSLSLKAYEIDGQRTFTVSDCDTSAAHVAFPDGVTAIDRCAFFNCASLTEITVPDGVTEIPYSAFEGCASLAQVTLPDSVVKIAENAFSRCPDVALFAPAGSAAQAFAEANPEDNVFWHVP